MATKDQSTTPSAKPTKSKTLYEIGDDLQTLADLIEDNREHMTDEQMNAFIDDYLIGVHNELSPKLEGYGKLIRNTLALAAASKNEKSRLETITSRREKFVTKLKERLILFFDSNGITKYETALFKFGIEGNGGLAPISYDEKKAKTPAKLPKRFQKVVIDTEAVREALEAGEKLDFAKLEPRGKHITIR